MKFEFHISNFHKGALKQLKGQLRGEGYGYILFSPGLKETQIDLNHQLIFHGQTINARLGKLACPRVNYDQKTDAGDQNLNSGCPHDAQIFKEGSCKNTVYFPYFLKVSITIQMKSNEGDYHIIVGD